MPAFRVRAADWNLDGALLRAVREKVFVEEQKVPVALELDEFDALSAHVLAEADDDTAIGTGRLLPGGHIGRMAVLPAWRGLGVGDAMLRFLLDLARRRRVAEVVLSAQAHAVGFYLRHGFRPEGDTFLDA